MSKLGSCILFVSVLLVGILTGYLGLNAASGPFAIHMAIFVLGCVLFLAFIARRAKEV